MPKVYDHFVKSFLSGCLCLLAGLFSLSIKAQGPVYRDSQATHSLSRPGARKGESVLLPLPAPISPRPVIKQATVKSSVDLGENFTFGNVDFLAQVRFHLLGQQAGITRDTLCRNCDLTLSTQKPEGLYFREIKNSLSRFDALTLSVLDVQVTVNDKRLTPARKQALQQSLSDALRVQLQYEISYGVPVTQTPPSGLVVFLDQKVAEFRWDTTGVRYAPNYQIQLLKLENRVDPQSLSLPAADPFYQRLLTGQAIVSRVDWEKALTLETGSSQRRVRLTLAEGSGYYLWRVRPIGTYYAGGITNPKNYGKWSNSSLSSNSRFDLFASPATVPSDEQAHSFRNALFYYQDPDQSKNTIYSRTFTEGNRMSEKITYANGLLQAKQTQTYLPSAQNRILSQTIYDYSSRPAMSTLPVPIRDTVGLRGYYPRLVRPNRSGMDTTRLYNASDFDSMATYRQPTPMRQQGTAFRYYTGQQHVADAEGYPFTRSRYYNDGTNRVLEQSGVGKTHMIGQETVWVKR